MWFPIDTETGTLPFDAVTPAWEVDFGPYNTTRVLQWISLQGPPSSSVNVYVNTVFIDTTPRGDLNRADYYAGIVIAAGQQVRLVWNTASGSAPIASIGCSDGAPIPPAQANIGQIISPG